MRRALALLTTVGLLATACASGTEGTPTPAKQARTTKTSTSRAPFHGERLDDGQVVKADKLDGIRLASPDDGHLRNYGVGVEVVDFGTGDIVDAGSGYEYGAREDSTLLAFRLRVTAYADGLEDKVKATVAVDGRQRSLPEFEYAVDTAGDDTTLQYLVAVPKDRREVELELKYADFAQRFDLLEGERTGEQPTILYRSPDEPFLYVENLTPAKLPVADAEGEPGAYVVAVTRATLTYFSPELGDVPSGDKKAWLIITYEPTSEGSLDRLQATNCMVPFAAFKLTDDEGGEYAVVDRHSVMDEYESEKRLVFEVPATLTEATLSLTTPGFPCTSGSLEYPFTSPGPPATVEVTLPED